MGRETFPDPGGEGNGQALTSYPGWMWKGRGRYRGRSRESGPGFSTWVGVVPCTDQETPEGRRVEKKDNDSQVGSVEFEGQRERDRKHLGTEA